MKSKLKISDNPPIMKTLKTVVNKRVSGGGTIRQGSVFAYQVSDVPTCSTAPNSFAAATPPLAHCSSLLLVTPSLLIPSPGSAPSWPGALPPPPTPNYISIREAVVRLETVCRGAPDMQIVLGGRLALAWGRAQEMMRALTRADWRNGGRPGSYVTM